MIASFNDRFFQTLPQGMFGIESVVTRIAAYLDLPPEVVRTKNLFKPGDIIPLGPINAQGDPHRVESPYNLEVMVDQIRQSSNFEKRREAIADFNTKHSIKKRGIALIPTAYSIGRWKSVKIVLFIKMRRQATHKT